jgi:hypothetical protein
MTTAQKLDRVCADIAELKALVAGGVQPSSPGMTRAEAMRYLKIKSDSAFYRWTAEAQVFPYARNSWRRADLDAGMVAVAMRRRKAKKTKTKGKTHV